jgi:hypothetical protein
MANPDEVQRILKLAVERIDRAKPNLCDVAVIQTARGDIKRVLAALEGQSTIFAGSSASTLRTVAKALKPINNAEVRGAWADVVEAAIMTEDSTRRGLE